MTPANGTARGGPADAAGTAPSAARSWLYVPAIRPGLLEKAMEGEADAVVLDLEDSVPEQHKAEARERAAEAARRTWPKPLWIRINQVGLPHGEADLAALSGASVQGLRLPKCEDPQQIEAVLAHLEVPLHLLVETALGVERAYELATAAGQAALLSLGEADLGADLRARSAEALAWARGRVVNAARAAGLAPPVQSVWTDVADLEGLAASCELARDRGFHGRSVVHPRQVAPVNAAFTPRPEEVEDARRLVDSLRQAGAAGSAAWLDDGGRLVDPAVVAQAHWVLELATGRVPAG